MSISLIAFMAKNWKLLAAVALVLGLFGLGYWKGHHAAALACQWATAKAEIAAQARDLEARGVADKFDRLSTDQLRDLATRLEKEKNDYEAELQKLPAEKRCPAYSPDDIKRLRKLRGQTQTG